jgi:predicted acetyltransferase
MPELTAPTPAVRKSFLRAVAEFRTEFAEHASGIQVFPDEIWPDETLASPEGFTAYVERLAEAALEDCAGRPPSHVPATTLWYVDGGAYLGRLSIRHRLTPFLLDVGGHIGYAVRPSQRCRGHATAMLAAALPYAYGLGIDPALLTCDADNVASRKVIERAGGVLEDQRGEKLRFWVPTSVAVRPE